MLDTPPERQFNALVEAVALVCDVPISLISLVDKDRQWFKANFGLDGVSETPREVSFCGHAILGDGLFEVSDAAADPRFAENPLVTASPDIRFYAGVPLRMKNGAQIGTICVIDRKPRNLTDAQRAILIRLSEVAVQLLESRQLAYEFAASEGRFRALSDGSPLGVFATDTEGACTYTNDRWQAIFGLSQTQAKGHGWSSTLHPQDKPMVFDEWMRAAAENHDFDMEFRVQHQDGVVRSVRAIARAVADLDGATTGFCGSVEDITERLDAQRALSDERLRLASIIEGTNVGTWEWNVQTGETKFNERWATIVGMTLEELGPLSIDVWTRLSNPDDLARSSGLLDQHFAGETSVYECEVRMQHADGHWIWVLVRGRVLTHTTDGKPEWMYGTQLDITHRKSQERLLRKSESLLNRTGELAEVGGWELDLVTNALILSDQACHIHGVSAGYRPSLKTAINFYSPEARPVVSAAIEHAIATGEGWDLELSFIQINEQRIWVHAVGQAEFENGVAVRLLGAFQNVTERVEQRQALEKAHSRLTLAADSGGIGVWEFDLKLGIIEMDAQMRRLYELPEGTLVNLTAWWSLRLHADDAPRVMAAMKSAISDHESYDDEFRLLLPDGSIKHLRAAAKITRDEKGQVARLVGVNWDVTAIRKLSVALADQHELLQVTMQSIGDAVITTDEKGRVTWLNPVAERMTGWASADAVGRAIDQVFHIVHEWTRELAKNPATTCLLEGETVGLASHTRLISSDGSDLAIEDSAAPIRNLKGEVLGAVLVFHDVTEQRRLSSEMNFRATHDTLTGLTNRAEFESHLKGTLQKAHEGSADHSLMYIDLDQFKLVNDACGHNAGDQLLRQVADLLGEVIRTRDILARIGGDEFAVILEDCTADQARRFAQEICDRMDDFRFLHNERSFRLGTSIGLVTIDNRWADITALMQAADTSCYAAKDAGRNRVHQWFDTDQIMRARHDETQWASRLERAIDEDQFVLYAQRIKSLRREQIGIHAEVLIRLRDTDGSLIQPGSFLPAAERFHLATRIDRWVLRHTVSHLAELPNLSSVNTLCVNLSGQSIGDRAFHREAIEILTKAGSEVCQRICFEITETAAITEMADAVIFIEQVRALGVRMALDDFGAGASSFGYLKTLGVDVIKVDGQFIKELNTDLLDAATVRCFVDIAKVVGAETVAEFVDRPELLSRVQEMGIDYAQGYLIHQPEALETVFDESIPSSSGSFSG